MNKYDAAKILNLSGEINPETVKKAYRSASKLYHPDRNPAGLEMMKAVNVAYEILKNLNETILLSADSKNYGTKLNDAINAVITLAGVNIEICGAWIWLSGDTRPHKDIIKSSGYKWASKKKMWYFRPSDYKSRSRGKFSIDDIRATYGSEEIRSKDSAKLK